MLAKIEYFTKRKGKKWMAIQRRFSRALAKQRAGHFSAAAVDYFDAVHLLVRAILIELNIISPSDWEDSSRFRRYVSPEKYFLINHQCRVIYCPINKVASSTLVRQLILDNNPEVEIEQVKSFRTQLNTNGFHTYSQYYCSLGGYSYEEAIGFLQDTRYVKCVFVRNPWSRLLSAYLNKVVKEHVIITRRLLEDFYKSKGLVPDYQKSITFRQFIEYITECDEHELDPHWQPQYLFLGNQPFDFIGKYETFAADFERLKQKLQLPNSELIKANSSRYSSQPIKSDKHFCDYYPCELKILEGFPDYKHFYTSELKDCIERYYQKDISLFSYTFDN